MHLCSTWMSFFTICTRSRSNIGVILNIDIPPLIIFFKTYIDNGSVVPVYEDKIVGTMKGFGIPCGLPWHLTDDIYVPINSNGEFHWVLEVVSLKEWCIKIYDSMSSIRSNRKLSYKIQKLSTMLLKYPK